MPRIIKRLPVYAEAPIKTNEDYSIGVGRVTKAGEALERFHNILSKFPELAHSPAARNCLDSSADLYVHACARKVVACMEWLCDPANNGTWATRSTLLLADCLRYAAYAYYHHKPDACGYVPSFITDDVYDRLVRFCVINRASLRERGIIPKYIAEDELSETTGYGLRILEGRDTSIYEAVVALHKSMSQATAGTLTDYGTKKPVRKLVLRKK